MPRSSTQAPLLRRIPPAFAILVVVGGLFGSCQASPPDKGNQAFAAMASRNNAGFQENGYLVAGIPGRRDYLAIKPDFRAGDDVVMGLDLDDFMQAGLDPARIDPADFPGATPVYDLPTSTYLISFDLGNPVFDFSGYRDKDGKKPAPVDASILMAEIIRTLPGHLQVDGETNCFGLSLGPQASFQWAILPPLGQAEAQNQVDLAFSLDPAPFTKAGLDPGKLQVWKLAPGNRLVLACHLP